MIIFTESIKLSEYIKLFNEICGENIANKLIETSTNGNIKLRDYTNNLKDLFFHKRDGTQCTYCKKEGYFTRNKVKRTIRDNRIMDYPTWDPHYPLNFNQKHMKKLMIIGQDPGPKIRSEIHNAYELNMFNLDEHGNYILEPYDKLLKSSELTQDERLMIEKQKNGTKSVHLLHFLMQLLDTSLEDILKNTYLTDICKCFDGKNKKILEVCSERYLEKEIELINPKLIIFQGNDSYDNFLRLMEDFIEEIELDFEFSSSNFPKIGKYKEKTFFVKIYHTARRNKYLWDDYLQDYCQLFKDKILPYLELS